MNPSERVAFRYLLAGTIRVPPGLLKEVTDWALSNWSAANLPHAQRRVDFSAEDVRRNENSRDIVTRTMKEVMGLLHLRDVAGASAAYEKFRKVSKLSWIFYQNPDAPYPEDFEAMASRPDFRRRLTFFFQKVIKEMDRLLVEDKDALAKWTLELDSIKIYRPKKQPKRQFTIEGNTTGYPRLFGFTYGFQAEYDFFPFIGGSWNQTIRRMRINSSLSDPDEVRRVVRHELQHAMQSFLTSTLAAKTNRKFNTPEEAGVGLPPRKDRTPKYHQNEDASSVGANPAYLHDLDDIEFHTELEDARDALRADLKRETEYTPSYVFSKFVDSNKFLKALRSVPDARRKYQTAVKELSKVLPRWS